MDIKSRLDLTAIFCDVEDFYQSFEKHCQSLPQLTSLIGEKLCRSLSVLPHWKKAFPQLVSYNGSLEVIP
jgi:hypothetical protein